MPALLAYFPVPYGSWICCAEAFALDARNQIAARAIGEKIARKVFPRCRIVVARAVWALPVRTCPSAARAPGAVRYGGEGIAEPPFERELLVPARPWRRPEQAPCWKVVIPTAGRLHSRAGAISRSDGLRCALVPSPPHLTARGARAANGHVRMGSARTAWATTIRHRGLKKSQARFLKAKTRTFRMMRSPIAQAAIWLRASSAKASAQHIHEP